MWRKRENSSLLQNFTMFTNAKAYNSATDLWDLPKILNCFSYLRSFVTDAIATSSGDDCIRIFQQVIHNQIVLQIFYVWYCTSQFRKLLYNTLANQSFAEPTETFQPLILLTTAQAAS